MTMIAAVLAALALAGWLAFLALGRTRGSIKRLAWRATLLLGAGAAFRWGSRHTAAPVLAAVLGVIALSYLYAVRFCSSCGRMCRNFKLAECARCGSPLPQHGLTLRPRRR